MRLPLLLLSVLLLLCKTEAQAQTVQVTGTVKDTASQSLLEQASVVLLQAKDSVLAGFGRTDANGHFDISIPPSDKYLILLSYPGYGTYTDAISLTQPVTDLGTLVMASREQILKEVVIKARQAAIRMVGDTTEYAADSFKVAEGATVEDLLKKLPGIQVDKTGKITAQGETIKKILVDGEEFFSDDPAVITKNMQSKAVSSVQVYDKKSETATFTGIDDGIREKVINLKLKDSMKRGYFGKAETGGGTNRYYQNQGMINAFKGKRKIAAYGILSNTAQTGLDYNDASKYGGTDNSFTFDEETGAYSGNGEEQENSYTGTGLPKVIAGGGHYSNKWNEGKEQLSANYKAQQLDIATTGSLVNQYLLPDSTYFSKQRNERFTRNLKQNVGGKFTWQKDSLTTILLTASGNTANGTKYEKFNTITESENGEAVNENNRSLDNQYNRQVLKANLSWQQKFRKKGRSLMVDANTNRNQGGAVTLLQSFNTYFNTGLQDSTIQNKTRNDQSLSFGGNAAYTEPLFKKVFLALNYGAGLTSSRSARFSYNKMSGTSDFSVTPDSLFSSDYAYRVLTQKGGATVRYVASKLTIGLGARVFHTNFVQEDYFRNAAPFRRSYLNWAPQANLLWNRSRMESLRISYSGTTRQPSIEQLQPFRQNTDPLNVAIGNPALKQEFSHNLNFGYNNYKALSGTYTYANAGLNVVQDAINQAQNIDELGRRTYQYINSGTNQSFYSYLGTGTKMKKLDLDVSLNGNVSYNTYHGFVNNVDNRTATTDYGLGFRTSKDWDKDDKMTHEISLEVSGNYRQNKSTLTRLAADYRSLQLELTTSNLLLWKLRLTNSAQANIRNRFSAADQRYNTVVWNMALSRKIGKRDAAEIRLSVFDILNQNLGFSRSVTNTVISEEAYTTIRRYGLLSFIWNFNSTPGAGGGNEED